LIDHPALFSAGNFPLQADPAGALGCSIAPVRFCIPLEIVVIDLG